jgi:hypothetical protein
LARTIKELHQLGSSYTRHFPQSLTPNFVLNVLKDRGGGSARERM